jgi:hypothetical protein
MGENSGHIRNFLIFYKNLNKKTILEGKAFSTYLGGTENWTQIPKKFSSAATPKETEVNLERKYKWHISEI